MSYETQKAFQTGVVVTITETLPPSDKMLAFLLERLLPNEYGQKKHIELSADDAFLKFLEKMEQDNQLERSDNARVIEHIPAQSSPTL